jgi:hypothetical protein
MKTFRRLNRTLSSLLVFLMLFLSINTTSYAGIVGTGVAINQQQSNFDRAELLAMFDRNDLRDELIAYGVDPNAARERIAAMSDTEVQALAGKVGTMPNGGDVVGVAVFLFLVLLFTDIMGWTDVFPFVH